MVDFNEQRIIARFCEAVWSVDPKLDVTFRIEHGRLIGIVGARPSAPDERHWVMFETCASPGDAAAWGKELAKHSAGGFKSVR